MQCAAGAKEGLVTNCAVVQNRTGNGSAYTQRDFSH